MSLYRKFVFPILCAEATRLFGEQRSEVFSQAAGRVLEVGVGLGASLPLYSHSVSEVIGLEYSDEMLHRTERELKRLQSESLLNTKVTLRQGDAQDLQFPDDHFDTVISFLLLCSVPEPETAASELYRVLKPGGKLLFFEHVISPDPKLSRWQSRLNPLWRRLACGCNLTRDTKSVLERAGFTFTELKGYDHPGSLRLTRFKIQGSAGKSEASARIAGTSA